MREDNNQQVFFALVRAGLWEEDVQLLPYGDIDFNEIYRLAEEQSVIGLVAAGLEHVLDIKVPKGIKLQFVGDALVLEERNKAMNTFISELVDKMRSAGINTLLVKGQGIAQCYERPMWRACGDVDFFLSDENYEKAKCFLVPIASSVEQEGIYGKHLGMTIDSWVVELHGTLRCSLSFSINRVLDEIKRSTFFDEAVWSWTNNGVNVFLLEPNKNALYVFTHFLNHFYKGGIGARQICDWCRLLWIYKDSVNHGLLESRIKKMGLMSEWKAFSAFAVEYLGMPADAMPLYDNDIKWKRKAFLIKNFVLMSGNFGHNRDMDYYKKYPYLISKLISFIRRIKDLINHARIFPMDSIKFIPSIMYNGIRSAARGE